MPARTRKNMCAPMLARTRTHMRAPMLARTRTHMRDPRRCTCSVLASMSTFAENSSYSAAAFADDLKPVVSSGRTGAKWMVSSASSYGASDACGGETESAIGLPTAESENEMSR